MARIKDDSEQFMTGYEKRVFLGYRKTASDLLKDDRMVGSVLRQCLNTAVPTEEHLESGEVVEVPIIVELVSLKLSYWKSNPDKIDLKELSTVLGELKNETNLNLPQASAVFGGIAVDRKPRKAVKGKSEDDSRSQ